MVNWLDIPEDLLSPIAYKLTQTVDYIRFGAVCSSWRSVYVQVKEHVSKESHVPLVLLYKLSRDNRFHTFQFPVPSNLICRGSSQGGWLVTESKEDNRIHLFNPFLSFNNQMHFPCLDKFLKAIVSSAADRVVVAIAGFPQSLFFIRPGDTSWTLIPKVSFAHDVIYCKDKFYVTRENGRIFVIDLTAPSPNVVEIKGVLNGVFFCKQYIVESAGDLLLVSRICKDEYRNSKFYQVTTTFRVYKVDSTAKKWIRLQTLGDYVLFLGDNSSLSLPAAEVGGYMTDCIYFRGDRYYDLVYGEEGDTGVFSLKDGSIKPLYSMDSKESCHAPVPIQPML